MMSSHNTDYDVAIVGGGLSGLTTALLLGRQGLRVICLDASDLQTTLTAAYDGRTTAISYGSQKLLAAAGVWDALESKACPIREIQILDGADSPLYLDFKSEEVGDESFGWIVENLDLRKALIRELDKLDHIKIHAPALVANIQPQEDRIILNTRAGDEITTSLMIGADGRNSFVREQMGIGARRWSYGQSAVICNVTHKHPHNYIAVEHFRTEGPFAVLPMADDEQGQHRSSVVWTIHGGDHENPVNWDEQTFNLGLQERFPAFYGKVERCTKPSIWPLGLVHAHSYIAERTALIADAAHGIHPIAGQGLNLGFRDVAVLADLIVKAQEKNEDVGAAALLEHYQRRRRLDNSGMAAATDGLNRLFSNRGRATAMARQIGMRAVGRIPFAKQFFMKQAMGSAGILPDLLKTG